MMRTRGHLCWLLLPWLLACSPPDSDPTRTDLPTGPAVSPAGEAVWRAELLEMRSRKDEEFATSETSPMAGTQYLKSEPTKQLFLVLEDGAFGLSYDNIPEAVLSVDRTAGGWTWQALTEEMTCRRGSEPVPSGAVIERSAVFSIGEFRLRFIPAEERVTFIAFDPRRQEKVAFEHLLYFAPDPAYAVHAKLLPFVEPEALVVPTSRGLTKNFFRYASIRFRIGGAEHRLTALKSALEGEGSKGLFIPFRDATSGEETYGAGRFLEIEEPTEKLFVLDFNLAFNPLCNYSPAYNCTIPPRENRLEIAILAGERTYPH